MQCSANTISALNRAAVLCCVVYHSTCAYARFLRVGGELFLDVRSTIPWIEELPLNRTTRTSNNAYLRNLSIEQVDEKGFINQMNKLVVECTTVQWKFRWTVWMEGSKLIQETSSSPNSPNKCAPSEVMRVRCEYHRPAPGLPKPQMMIDGEWSDPREPHFWNLSERSWSRPKENPEPTAPVTLV